MDPPRITVDMNLCFRRVTTALVILGTFATSIVLAVDDSRKLGRIKVKNLAEISGIAASRHNSDIVWMHNDGDVKQIYAVKTSGKVAAQLRAPKGIEDLEDIAIGPGPDSAQDYLYLGDIGDNDAERRTIQIMRFPEPVLGTTGQEYAANVEVITLYYPDGPHDSEALLVDPATGAVFIVTKQQRGAAVYVAGTREIDASQPNMLRQIAKLDVDEVSAGDISSDGRRLALRSEKQGWLWDRVGSESFERALARAPAQIPVRGAGQGPNGEALAFSADGRSYFTMSEGKKESLYSFRTPTSIR